MTVSGNYTVAELADLVAAKDFDQTALANHYAQFAPTWVEQDPTGFVSWTNDWNAMKARYADARKQADTALLESEFVLTPNNLIQAQAPYQLILSALTQVTGTVTAGDFSDLDKRLQLASGSPTSYIGEPQPSAGSDITEQAYLATDLVWGAVPSFAQSAVTNWPWWVVPSALVVGGVFIIAKVKDILK